MGEGEHSMRWLLGCALLRTSRVLAGIGAGAVVVGLLLLGPENVNPILLWNCLGALAFVGAGLASANALRLLLAEAEKRKPAGGTPSPGLKRWPWYFDFASAAVATGAIGYMVHAELIDLSRLQANIELSLGLGALAVAGFALLKFVDWIGKKTERFDRNQRDG